MHSGDFGQLMKRDTSIQRWRMSWSSLRRKLHRDLKLGIVQRISKCLDLVQHFIKNLLRSTTSLIIKMLKNRETCLKKEKRPFSNKRSSIKIMWEINRSHMLETFQKIHLHKTRWKIKWWEKSQIKIQLPRILIKTKGLQILKTWFICSMKLTKKEFRIRIKEELPKSTLVTFLLIYRNWCLIICHSKLIKILEP